MRDGECRELLCWLAVEELAVITVGRLPRALQLIDIAGLLVSTESKVEAALQTFKAKTVGELTDAQLAEWQAGLEKRKAARATG